MASEKLLQNLADLWSVCEARSRWFEPRLREGRERDAFLLMLAVRAVQIDIYRADERGCPMADRQVAKWYPEVVQAAVSHAYWQKIKPDGWE